MWFLEFCRKYREKLIERGAARKGCSARKLKFNGKEGVL